jgi:hypothetical protein
MFTNRRRILKHLLEHIRVQYDDHQALSVYCNDIEHCDEAKELLPKAGIMHGRS